MSLLTIPRETLVWLMVAQVLVILPHLAHLPLWIVALWLGCGLWRVRIYRMQASYPPGWLKGLAMLVVGAGVYLSHGGLVGLDAGVTLLIAAFILKLVEMRSRRDAVVVIFLGFFAVATSYLFEDGLLAGLFSLLPILVLLAAMIGLQQSRLFGRPWPAVRLAGGLLLQAVPLMLVLFVFFPRVGPLWSLPQSQTRGTTGLAEEMAPGDIAELSQSGELAFRASFSGELPPREALYWRALTFEQFDGRRWARGPSSHVMRAPAWTPQGAPLDYSVVMQPSGQPWLFALDVPELPGGEAQLMGDFHLQRSRPVEAALMYRVRSWPAAVRQPRLPQSVARAGLQLPAQGNPRSRAWATELKATHPTPQALVEALLRHFNQAPYAYTLKPPPVGEDIVDGFLFDTRRGFCIHYAGAMTFVLRAAGIPSRVVVGYQGGELNEAGSYVSVRQLDAHAWVEYWLAGRGWIRVDPTFQVAPERIEQGLVEAVPEERALFDDSAIALLRYRDIGWLNDLRLKWEGINYGWQRWVLGYQGDEQLALIQRWFGSVDYRALGAGVVGALAIGMAVLALVLFKPWRNVRDRQREGYARFEQALARHGVRRQPGEGPRAFGERAAQRLPERAEVILAFVRQYEAQRYAGQTADSVALDRALRRVCRQLRWRAARLRGE
ncbi:DUF3488 domain-containing transglutaminase family protein [Stutzerimonas urumqiensis]|uniref:transglutaminase TgpA family protein n=1 Tax=Stutzerimonas urumqiensis TaxID=638269 RepID=UPI003BAB8D0D